jgi:GH35 family endo-1,4-beta-xylanase
MDINLTWLPGGREEKYYKQGEIAHETMKGILASKVVAAVNFWGVEDKDSWLVNEQARYGETGGSENADPLPFHNGSPKPFFYALQKALLENLPYAD